MVTRWAGTVVVALAAVVVGGLTVAGGHRAPGIALTLGLVVFAWLVSPLLAPRGPGWETARRRAQERGVPLVLWKPGCAFCMRLRLALGWKGSQAVWVDISADEEAAAAAREVNDGDETTPTVITLDGALTNPSPAVVRGLLRTR